MANTGKEKFVYLLIVDHVGDTIVAEIDNFNDVKVGDMVEVDVDGTLAVGTVCFVNWAQVESDDYNFVAALHSIYPVTKWWHRFNIENGND